MLIAIERFQSVIGLYDDAAHYHFAWHSQVSTVNSDRQPSLQYRRLLSLFAVSETPVSRWNKGVNLTSATNIAGILLPLPLHSDFGVISTTHLLLDKHLHLLAIL